MREAQLTIEGKILDAIFTAKKNMQRILSINMNKEEESRLLNNLVALTGKKPTPDLKVTSIYGVPIKRGKELSITIKI